MIHKHLSITILVAKINISPHNNINYGCTITKTFSIKWIIYMPIQYTCKTVNQIISTISNNKPFNKNKPQQRTSNSRKSQNYQKTRDVK
jgi:hypothetical protein